MRIELHTVTLNMKHRSKEFTKTFFGRPTIDDIVEEFKPDWSYDSDVRESLEECGEFEFATWKPSKNPHRRPRRNDLLVPTWTSTFMKHGHCLATLTMTLTDIPCTKEGQAKLLVALAEEAEEALA